MPSSGPLLGKGAALRRHEAGSDIGRAQSHRQNRTRRRPVSHLTTPNSGSGSGDCLEAASQSSGTKGWWQISSWIIVNINAQLSSYIRANNSAAVASENFCVPANSLSSGAHLLSQRIVIEQSLDRRSAVHRATQQRRIPPHHFPRAQRVQAHRRNSRRERFHQRQPIALMPRRKNIQIGQREKCALAVAGHVPGNTTRVFRNFAAIFRSFSRNRSPCMNAASPQMNSHRGYSGKSARRSHSSSASSSRSCPFSGEIRLNVSSTRASRGTSNSSRSGTGRRVPNDRKRPTAAHGSSRAGQSG